MSQVTLTIAGKDQRITLDLLGADDVTGGDGIWTSTDRPERTPMTTWEGTSGLVWVLPLSFDNFDSGRSAERKIAQLDSWRRPDDKRDKPAILEVDAPLGRAPATARWVIQGIEWGEQIRNDEGERIRQDIILTLLQYQPGAIKKGPAAKSRDGKTHKWVPISAKDRRCETCKRERDNKVHSNR